MTDHETIRRKRNLFRKIILAILSVLVAALPNAWSDGMRNIASLTVDYYFDGSFTIEAIDVFLLRCSPVWSIQARGANVDTQGSMTNSFGLGPVINFSENLYTDIRYSIGLDSRLVISHEGELNLSYETDTATVSGGARGTYFPDTSFWYVIPTASGSLRFDQLLVFAKFFVSINSESAITSSVWAETSWSFTPEFAGIAGFTLSYADALGYSVLGGIELEPMENMLLKYKLQFLSNSIVYGTDVRQVYGIQNVLILDIMF